MSDIFLFIALPYIAIIVMLVGSVYVYRTLGNLVTSLSTQFLENRELFWGGMLMHWSIILLFLGHLIAFLVPGAVLAWNGSPVRLIILESVALVCGLAFLIGVSLLIFRRLSRRKLWGLTTNMDIAIFLVLLLQAVTGVWIALGYRWGSSWFASILTHYLRSLFILQPDIAAISALPALIKVHIITAFVLLSLIPFSRFMHFLVFPVRYFWRPYQLVIWNRDRRLIRKSTAITPEIKPKNS